MARKFLILSVFLLSFNANATFISSGTGEIYGTWSFDFESATLCDNSDPNCDVFWKQISDIEREMTPIQSAMIIALGSTSFSSITESDLLTLAYGTAPIEGPPVGSLLDVGNVFAVNTSEGNYALVEVSGYSDGGSTGNIIKEYYDIHIKYNLYDGQIGVPEPGILSLIILGLLGVIYQRRKNVKKC